MPSKPKVIAITSPESPELAVLKQLEGVADVVAIGQDAATLGLADDVWPSIDIMLNCGARTRSQTTYPVLSAPERLSCVCRSLITTDDVTCSLGSCRRNRNDDALRTGIDQPCAVV